MKLYEYDSFSPNEAWLVFRLDTQVKNEPVDIYTVVDLPSGLILGHTFVVKDILSKPQAKELLNVGLSKKSKAPRKLLVQKDDPGCESLEAACKELSIMLSPTPLPYLENIIGPIKESFGEHCYSPSTLGYAGLEDDVSEEDRESAKQFVPDSYDPCPCASGEKFKFCCKPAFREIVLSQALAQDGKKTEAIKQIQKAKSLVGETAEVVCREAIVYSFFDRTTSKNKIRQALEINPKHPRANYIQGIILKEAGDLKEAAKAYKNAIDNYPKTDRYHLNETYNNLGTTYYDMGNVVEAKNAWEQALALMPSDTLVKRNLKEFIYENSDLNVKEREISPFVKRFFAKNDKG